MKDDCYAEGGEVDDNEVMMDHCAMEMMHAIENKDKRAMLDSMHALVADILNKMQPEEAAEGDSNDNG